MANRILTEDLQTQLDKVAVAELVQTERAARDEAQWDRMLECFHPDSQVEISWFRGSGPDFVEASKRLYRAAVTFHQMGPSVVRVEADRALADTGCIIVVKGRLGTVEAETTTFARLHERLERRDATWRISGLRIVYLADSIRAGNPSDQLPIDATKASQYRPSYRWVSYMLGERGESISPDLPGLDRPKTVETLLATEENWLLGRG
jgi:hypothetical protein